MSFTNSVQQANLGQTEEDQEITVDRSESLSKVQQQQQHTLHNSLHNLLLAVSPSITPSPPLLLTISPAVSLSPSPDEATVVAKPPNAPVVPLPPQAHLISQSTRRITSDPGCSSKEFKSNTNFSTRSVAAAATLTTLISSNENSSASPSSTSNSPLSFVSSSFPSSLSEPSYPSYSLSRIASVVSTSSTAVNNVVSRATCINPSRVSSSSLDCFNSLCIIISFTQSLSMSNLS